MRSVHILKGIGACKVAAQRIANVLLKPLPGGDRRSLTSMRRNDRLLQLSKLKPMGASHPRTPFPCNPVQPVRSGLASAQVEMSSVAFLNGWRHRPKWHFNFAQRRTFQPGLTWLRGV